MSTRRNQTTRQTTTTTMGRRNNIKIEKRNINIDDLSEKECNVNSNNLDEAELNHKNSETWVDNNQLRENNWQQQFRNISWQPPNKRQQSATDGSTTTNWHQSVQQHQVTTGSSATQTDNNRQPQQHQLTTGNSATSIDNKQFSTNSWQLATQAATIDNKQLSTTNWQQAVQQQQLTTTSSAQPIDNWQFRRYFWSKSTTSWHRTRNDTVVAYIGVEFRNEGINHSKYASRCKVIFCDTYRTARKVCFRGPQVFPLTHVWTIFSKRGCFQTLKPRESHRGLQKHIASQACIARLGELSFWRFELWRNGLEPSEKWGHHPFGAVPWAIWFCIFVSSLAVDLCLPRVSRQGNLGRTTLINIRGLFCQKNEKWYFFLNLAAFDKLLFYNLTNQMFLSVFVWGLSVTCCDCFSDHAPYMDTINQGCSFLCLLWQLTRIHTKCACG